MDNQELIKGLKFEYWGYIAAVRSDAQHKRTSAAAISFYDFLLTRGFNRWQLSAMGMGRDITA